MSKTNIIVKLDVEGLHNWPAAKEILPQVAYLSDLHRHRFFITAKKAVMHDDRDVEIIMFKNEIRKYLQLNYFSTHDQCLMFGSKSCEMLAKELLNEFDLCYCSVLEDDENGAEIYGE